MDDLALSIFCGLFIALPLMWLLNSIEYLASRKKNLQPYKEFAASFGLSHRYTFFYTGLIISGKYRGKPLSIAIQEIEPYEYREFITRIEIPLGFNLGSNPQKMLADACADTRIQQQLPNDFSLKEITLIQKSSKVSIEHKAWVTADQLINLCDLGCLIVDVLRERSISDPS